MSKITKLSINNFSIRLQGLKYIKLYVIVIYEIG